MDKYFHGLLNTPILHLLRNAVDHGVETPEKRRAAGKAPCGRISLSARQEGNEVVIEVTDDGAGIDAYALWEHAQVRGLVDPGQSLTRQENLSLIFVPGLSTASGVGALSGRGVGMDAAREGIESLRGEIGVESEPGRGTVFTIRLPVSLAIIDCLEVRAGGQAEAFLAGSGFFSSVPGVAAGVFPGVTSISSGSAPAPRKLRRPCQRRSPTPAAACRRRSKAR